MFPLVSRTDTILTQKKRDQWGNPLAKFWLLSTVSGTDTNMTKEKKKKKGSVWELFRKF